jgi:hypothetical protein
MDVFMVALGVGLTIAVYIIYIAMTHGVPYAWAMLKTWWTKGAADLATIKADIASLKTDVTALKAKVP